jgi:glycosyltransferase involved in cell wall biosynthesis
MLASANFDIIHYLFIEEICNWKPPSERALTKIADRLRWWQSRCQSIVVANHLYPNCYDGNIEFKKLFDLFYGECSLILHFSEVSRRLVYQEFQGSRHDRHIVTHPYNYIELIKKQDARGDCRARFGFKQTDFIILVIGLLRTWEEIKLIANAYSALTTSQKKLLMAGRFEPTFDSTYYGRFRRKWQRVSWRLWLKWQNAVVNETYIPDEELYRFLDTADVVLVPRILEITSGIPSLAMTFGKMIIAPSRGAFPEYLAGTENLFYHAGDPKSLADAIEKATRCDRSRVGKQNRKVAEQWQVDNIVALCLDRLGKGTRLISV